MSTSPFDRFPFLWNALAERLGLDVGLRRSTGSYLAAQYSRGDRYYHGVRHIVSMLEGFEPLRSSFLQPDAAELAIFFHDLIYDPARSDNEERSAAKMKSMLDAVVYADILGHAAFTIEATKMHVATWSRDTNLVIDLDMAILGEPWPVYERYAKGVMEEYVPVYGEEAYREGRRKLFLEPTIEAGEVFLTEEFKPLTGQAMENMRREVRELTSQLPKEIP